MKTDNIVLMKMARESLKGKWVLAIATALTYILIPIAIHTILLPISFGNTIIYFLIAGPLSLGLATFSLSISRNKEAKVGQLFDGFNQFVTSLKAYLLILVIVVACTFLFVFPGIIMAIAYSMTFYIIADDPSIRASEAMVKSKQMMRGNKLKYFFLTAGYYVLAILFIGFILTSVSVFFGLGSLGTFLAMGGIGLIAFIWLFPFIQITCAKFYEDIKPQEIVAE